MNDSDSKILKELGMKLNWTAKEFEIDYNDQKANDYAMEIALLTPDGYKLNRVGVAKNPVPMTDMVFKDPRDAVKWILRELRCGSADIEIVVASLGGLIVRINERFFLLETSLENLIGSSPKPETVH